MKVFCLLLTLAFGLNCSKNYNCFQSKDATFQIIARIKPNNSTCSRHCKLSLGDEFVCTEKILKPKNFQLCKNWNTIGNEIAIRNTTCSFPKNFTACDKFLNRKHASLICTCSQSPDVFRNPVIPIPARAPITDVNECASNPCNGSSCIDYNLTNFNVTNTSCVCDGILCLQVANTTSVNGSQGNYLCSQYSNYVTRNFQQSICNVYVQTNGTFNFTLSATIRSLNVTCGSSLTFELSNPSGQVIYRTLRIPNNDVYILTEVDFVLPNCTTITGCTEVINCGNDTQCRISNNTCFDANTTNVQLDNWSNASACFPSLRVKTTQCPSLTFRECLKFDDIYDFFANGDYYCVAVNPFSGSCLQYQNVNNYTLIQTVPVSPNGNCTDDFFWTLSNGTTSLTAPTSDPRLGPTNASFPPMTFDICYLTFECGNCSAGFERTSFTQCTPINECLSENGNCINSFCSSVNGNTTCGPCFLGYYVDALTNRCIKNMSTAILRVTIVESHSNAIPGPNDNPYKVDIYPGSQNTFLLTPAPFQLLGRFATIYGQQTFQMLPGNYTYFASQATTPTPNNGVGRQHITYEAAEDIFLTLYYVPRVLFNFTTTRVFVLTWQSQELPPSITQAQSMTFYFQKYIAANNYSCSSPACCLAFTGSGPCGTIEVTGSPDSNGVQEGYLSSVERQSATGPFFSYLVYTRFTSVRLFPQINIFSLASARNPVAGGTFDYVSPPTPPLAINYYWPVACIQVNSTSGAITIKDLKNSSFSPTLTIPPEPIEYCM